MDAVLENIQLRVTGGAALTPAFSPEITSYRATVDGDIAAAQFRAWPWTLGSKLTLNNQPLAPFEWYTVQLATGDNLFAIQVTSAGGGQSKVYTVIVVREDAQPVIDKFLKFVYRDDATGLTMPYRLFVPADYRLGKAYPLVLFLHGGGERGADNEQQLRGPQGAVIWAKPAEQAKRPCFVLAPQAHAADDPDSRLPFTGFGITRDKANNKYLDEALTPSVDLELAMKVLTEVRQRYTVDDRRLYVTGLSQGGFGAWNANILYPDLFAALAPICGGGDPAQAHKLVGKPVWAFHAEDDPVIPVSYSRATIAALRGCGGKPLYSEYPSGTYIHPHEHYSWVLAYQNAAMREWLFEQVKR